MTASIDAASSFESASSAETNVSWTHTPSGTPTGVLLWLYSDNAHAPVTVTYGGQAMSLVASNSADASSPHTTALYELVNPPSGAQTVVWDTGAGNTSWKRCVCATVVGGGGANVVTDAVTAIRTGAGSATYTINITVPAGKVGVAAVCGTIGWGDFLQTGGATSIGYVNLNERELRASYQAGSISAMTFSCDGNDGCSTVMTAAILSEESAGGSSCTVALQ